MLYDDGKLNIHLKEQTLALKEVVISAEKAKNVNNAQLGVERLDIKAIKQVPAVFGEADILKAVLTLPGVQSVGEASTGLNVRGGATDQNLILFDNATIYNPSHFFGFFSAFNPEAVKDVELYKASIPAKYGGRLSAVLDVSGREGNQEKFTGSAGLGLITSRLNIEGPIIPFYLACGQHTQIGCLIHCRVIRDTKIAERPSRMSILNCHIELTPKINCI
jgi:hypothetical protein